jgi:hypothetical protein
MPVFQSAKVYHSKKAKFQLENTEGDIHNNFGHEYVPDNFEDINPGKNQSSIKIEIFLSKALN